MSLTRPQAFARHRGFIIALALVASVLSLDGAASAQGLGGPGSSVDPGEGSGSRLPTAGTGVTNPGSIDPGDQGGGGGGGAGDADGKGKDQAPPPPPALPGSHASPTAVVPADKVVADMEPTAALFDAINRGDAVAARDAINRGASLDGRNVLGLTPIELSVDLNRNDISFLLLSMRGAAGVAPGSPDAARSRAPRLAPISTTAAASRARGAPPEAPVATAAPDAGFLGFGRPTRF